MLWSFGFNSVLGLLMAITMCFTLGDVDNILNSATGYPFIQVFYNVTQVSRRGRDRTADGHGPLLTTFSLPQAPRFSP